ncbi:hypothetical protein BH24PSE2_BH24PSE2_06790 [soil metagenome]
MRTINGIIAGFIATIVLSLLMLMKSAMGMMPEVNVIQMLAKMGSMYAGLPLNPMVGWVMHFVIGSIAWGAIFAWATSVLPGGFVMKGIVFSVAAWVLMMIGPMPMAGAGLFGLNLGVAAPIATLVLHIIFGAVLGGTFGWLEARRKAGAPEGAAHGAR